MAVTYTTSDIVNGEFKRISHVDQYEGATLKVYWQLTRVMSDVWENCPFALVWDEPTNEPRTINLNAISDASEDATSEVLAKYRKHYFDIALRSLVSNWNHNATTPSLGKTVRVMRGRKDVGKIGKVVHSKVMLYGQYYGFRTMDKLCIALNDSKETIITSRGKKFDRYTNVIWVWSINVDVIDIPTLTDREMADFVNIANYKIDKMIQNLVEYKGVYTEHSGPNDYSYTV